MVDFLRKRLQVFVSSTFTDLKMERQAAVEAILTAGHIPAGMELFTSGDESQMEVIQQWIDESDVYMLILGGRYGCIESKSGKSYTRLEYEYAIAKNKPFFACLITDEALEQKVQHGGLSVIERGNTSGLNEFRHEVQTRLVKYWEDHKDIKIAVGETLAQFSRRNELVGWVRPAASEVDMSGLLNEIARLSHENSTLREQITTNHGQQLIQGLHFSELYELLQRKNLLNYLLDHRNELLEPWGFRGHEELDGYMCQELHFLGLLTANGFDNNSYSISPDGRFFLNRLDLNLLRKHEKSSKGAKKS